MKLLSKIFIVLIGFLAEANTSDHLSLIDSWNDDIEYKASMDDHFVYVDLSTANTSVMISMLRRGFHVYFDIKGKKKRKVSITYPVRTKKPEGDQSQSRGERRGGRPEQGEEPNMVDILNKLPKEALYEHFDLKETFNLDLNKLDVAINYTYDKNEYGGVLHYKLKIPKNRIAKDGEDLSKLSIGVISTSLKQERPQLSGNSGSGQRSSGPPGGGGGGRGGGGRSGGGPPGGNQGGSSQSQQPQLQDIKIWFKPS